LARRSHDDRYIDPETCQAITRQQEGSWWPAWHTWLQTHSSGPIAVPQRFGAADRGYPPLAETPGTYVLQQ
jgi:polyhydroxyalkanoate synthase